MYNDKESFGRYCGSVHTPVITTAENVFHVDLLSDGDPGIKMLAFYTVTGNVEVVVVR